MPVNLFLLFSHISIRIISMNWYLHIYFKGTVVHKINEKYFKIPMKLFYVRTKKRESKLM